MWRNAKINQKNSVIKKKDNFTKLNCGQFYAFEYFCEDYSKKVISF